MKIKIFLNQKTNLKIQDLKNEHFKFVKKKLINISALFFITCLLIFNIFTNNWAKKSLEKVSASEFDRYFNQPVIFIGGSMSSGTSLVRSILDAHPTVNCGPETKLIHLELTYLHDLLQKDNSSLNFMKNAGVTKEMIQKSFGILVYYLMLRNSPGQYERICNKEPSNRLFIDFFHDVFPKSKFIYVVRDGREAIFSLMKRSYMKPKFEKFLELLKLWNSDNEIAYNKCLKTGPNYCKMVRYENLVNRPQEEIKKLAEFLGLSWTNRLLNHEKYIDTKIKMSKTEWSRKGLEKKINNASLRNWEGNVLNYDQNAVNEHIHMLKVLEFI